MRPFVLLDDARAGGRARLFTGLAEIVEAREPHAVAPALERLRQAAPRHAAGFLSYEAGYALEPKLAPLATAVPPEDPPLLWFGLFDRSEEVDASAFLVDPRGAWTSGARPMVAEADYLAALAQVREHIFAGDIYQANITFPANVPVEGHPLALYAAVRSRARAGHGAVLWTGQHWILSFSPELFFTLDGGRVTTRPMKGTAPRRADPAADAAEIEALRSDEKQRAENLMIVDLLRNDLSKIAAPASVRVPELFAVETYPTVHQMVSAVTADLAEGLGPVDVLRALFPCGSITGAPKIRAMEIISALEKRSRGVYCGAIGCIAPDGSADFNVAIRTLTLPAGAAVARLGLGSGIVADSRPRDEWRECLAKGAFLTMQDRRFDLIETMRFDPSDGVLDIERHFDRLKRSADALGFDFDRHDARNELQAATFGAKASRVRLMLSQRGAVSLELRPLEPAPAEPVEVALVPLGVDRDDFRLRHKTSDRDFYDEPRRAAGTWEVVFTDADGFCTEGSFTSLFVERGGVLLTPPLSRGLLPGVLRERLLDRGEAEEADLRPEDLSGGFLIGNALRGLIRARLR